MSSRLNTTFAGKLVLQQAIATCMSCEADKRLARSCKLSARTHPVGTLPSAFGACTALCTGGFHSRNDSGMSIPVGTSPAAAFASATASTLLLLLLLSLVRAVSSVLACSSLCVSCGTVTTAPLSCSCCGASAAAAATTGIDANACLTCSCCSSSFKLLRARDTSVASTSTPSTYAGSMVFAAAIPAHMPTYTHN